MENNEIPKSEDVREHIAKHGLVEIEAFFKRKLEEWKDVKISIAVTGSSGVGKSSLINAIIGVKVAETGVKETTKKPCKYTCPGNKNIEFWDLPGIGTPNYPDLKTYCEKVGLEKYDTFLILSASRFTENDLQLAKKVESIKKSFFFVRTKIDHDIDNQQFDHPEKNVDSTLAEIKEDCEKNLSTLAASKKNMFLISNHHTDKWDFLDLRKAILDALLPHQRESLILSLTSDSMDVIKQKVAVLRDRIWMVAFASAAVAALPVPEPSTATDFTFIVKEFNFYKSQIPFPEEHSEEFRRLSQEVREQISQLVLTSVVQIGNLLATYVASAAAEEHARFIPLVGSVIAGSFSFGSTYFLLEKRLAGLEETACKLLNETGWRVAHGK